LFRFQAEARNFSLFLRAHIVSGGYPSYYAMATGEFFAEDKEAEA
jgi:hypothetical protein